eukprot:1765703-Alexandrium_andersonii.AAC.1
MSPGGTAPSETLYVYCWTQAHVCLHPVLCCPPRGTAYQCLLSTLAHKHIVIGSQLATAYQGTCLLYTSPSPRD